MTPGKIFIAIRLVFLLSFCVPAALQAHGPKDHEDRPPAAESSAVPLAGREDSALREPPTDGEGIAAPVEVQRQGASKLLTNLHPATIHFPIALLLFAALAEACDVAFPSARLRAAAEIAAAAGGIAATVAALFGWIHTGLWFGGGDVMQWHRWIGTGLGVAGPVIAWLALRGPDDRKALRAALAAATLAVLAQSWLGAELGHGAGHLWQ